MPQKINPRVKLTLSLTVISAILGLMLSTQYKHTRATAQMQAQVLTADPKAKYTAEQLKKVKDENMQLEASIEKLRKQMFDIEKQAAETGKSDAPELQDELTKYKIMAGLLPVKGQGITFTVSDSQLEAGSYDPSRIWHDYDLRMLVNELYLGGAEAVTINNNRVTTTTGIMCIGPTVMINGRQKIAPPFEFKAIGNPRMMSDSLTVQGGVFDALTTQRHLTVSKIKQGPMILPPYTGDFNGLSK